MATSLVLLGSACIAAAQPKSGLQLPPPLNPAEAEAKGRALVTNLLSQRPAEDTTNTGVLSIRDAEGQERQIPVRFEIVNTPTNWLSLYQTAGTGPEAGIRLSVGHAGLEPNVYWLSQSGTSNSTPLRLTGNETMISFAGSDFWVADLGLEFLHWPKQLQLKQEMRRSRSCNVLESVNPQPAPGAYSRVVAWIDIESGGIVHADAYDAGGHLFKQFDPKEFTKVQGQWQLQEMEIRNRQTGSRTKIEFNLR